MDERLLGLVYSGPLSHGQVPEWRESASFGPQQGHESGICMPLHLLVETLTFGPCDRTLLEGMVRAWPTSLALGDAIGPVFVIILWQALTVVRDSTFPYGSSGFSG